MTEENPILDEVTGFGSEPTPKKSRRRRSKKAVEEVQPTVEKVEEKVEEVVEEKVAKVEPPVIAPWKAPSRPRRAKSSNSSPNRGEMRRVRK